MSGATAAERVLAERAKGPLLLAATFVVAVAGLVYELIAGAAASYLLGDSVTQFSLVIGLFMSAMGLGAWASRFVDNAEAGFTAAQVALGVAGGFSAPLLFLAYAYAEGVEPLLFALVIGIGTLSGLEIPLITRILDGREARRFTLANVLTADYAGALIAAMAFPFLVVPQLGLVAGSLTLGVLNLSVAALSLWLFRDRTGWRLRACWAVGFAACVAGLACSDRLVSIADAALYEDEVIFAADTPAQRITVTRFGDRTRLFLNSSLQFDSLDEYRYHEALVHPAMARAARRQEVLVLGGGDGMAVREALRWPEVRRVTLVDLDPEMTRLFRDHPDLSALNGGALSDPRVRIVNRDAWAFVAEDRGLYDVILLDLPDPHDLSISRLYSIEFFSRLVERLSGTGLIAGQSGSPLFGRVAFWSVVESWEATRNPLLPGAPLTVIPYHVYVPSFGDWGFTLVSPRGRPAAHAPLPAGLRFYEEALWPAMTAFPADMARVSVKPNSIRSHPLPAYYEAGWNKWFR